MLTSLRNRLEQFKGSVSHLKKQKDISIKSIETNQKEMIEWEEALVHLQAIVQTTQQTLEYRISEICSLAEQAVFDDPYKIGVEFNIKRKKTECDIIFSKKGRKIGKPLESSGYGAIDVASASLRPALICIKKPKVRNLLLLDEPFRNLGDGMAEVKVLQQRASNMMRKISEKLGMQIVMVSHNKEIITSADNVIEI